MSYSNDIAHAYCTCSISLSSFLEKKQPDVTQRAVIITTLMEKLALI